ncbi:hypothetical protein PESP_b0193 [Pseudoalteromonas espejiana DSM 9414]|uniref:Uncharacterized protein n=2 Tax=Pseudoalteromonas espejiana TaxID=28107 RepID=A0A510XVF8_9GAMM|nr:hypothetical protein PESP_b0193 [Pseudoalteromonas espejiana DSM 9414]GEK55026.1 hypothetical protein PES01_18710 [Pseudoalteromonas espejiana]
MVLAKAFNPEVKALLLNASKLRVYKAGFSSCVNVKIVDVELAHVRSAASHCFSKKGV